MNIREFGMQIWAGRREQSFKDGCLLAGCRLLYELAGKKDKKAIKSCLKAAAAACAESVEAKELFLPGKVWFLLYDETGDAFYRKQMDICMDWIRHCERDENGIFLVPQMECTQIYPFYMEYETRYLKKADYQDIVRQLLAKRPSEAGWEKEAGWYLMTVIDVIESMSREIFEHYKSLEGIFKKTVRDILEHGWEKELCGKEKALAGCAIAKACHLGVLNREKYLETGLVMLDSAVSSPENRADSADAGIYFMAYAQKIFLSERIFCN